MPTLYAIAISAENDKRFVCSSGCVVAVDEPAARELGLQADDWYNHRCSLYEVPQEKIRQVQEVEIVTVVGATTRRDSTRDPMVQLPSIREETVSAITAGEQALATPRSDFTEEATIGDDLTEGAKVTTTYEKAYERIVVSTSFVLNQLEMGYKQAREQSQGWFRYSLVAAGLGFLLIAIGVVAAVLGQTTAGIITAVSSIVPNAAAALFFVQSRSANDRTDAIQTKLTEARELQSAVEVVNTIEDTITRNKLKSEIVRKVLRAPSTSA
jgi:hypothetical protein